MPQITLKAFCDSSPIAPSLIRAVVRQHGGWDAFKQDAENIFNHGADAGYGGWIYTSDCTSFTRRNRAAIVQELSSQAADQGEDLCSMVAGFNCLRDHKLSASDVGRVLFSGRGGDEDVRILVENALAWSTLEDVARAYVDWREQDQD